MASANGIRAGSAYVELTVKTKGFLNRIDATLGAASAKIDSFAQKQMKALADAFVVGAGAAYATKIFAAFDDQMRIVQAVSGATGKAFDELTSRAKELGRTTAFTASQVAEGMAGLGRAGFKSDEIDKAIASVMALSSATATDLALATDIAGNTLRAFGMDAAEMGRVCDVLTATANGSAQTVEDLGEALKFVAPIAATTGMSLEDTSKVLGTLANFGIKGSNAGTAFKNMRTRMADASVQEAYRSVGVETIDDTGALRNLSDVLKDLGVAVQNIPDAERLSLFQELFGMYGLAGGSVLATAEGFDELYNAIDNASGAAEKTQNAMEAGLGGSLRSALSACEGLAIALGEALAPTVQDLAEGIKTWTARLNALVGASKPLVTLITKTAVKYGAFAAALLVAAKAGSIFVAKAKSAVDVAGTIARTIGSLTGITKAHTAAVAAKTAVERTSAEVSAALRALAIAQTQAETAAANAQLKSAMTASAKAAKDYAAASAALAHKVAVVALGAACTVAAAGVAALAAALVAPVVMAERNVRAAEEMTRAAEERAASNEQARQKDAELFDELVNLASQSELTNEEFARGKNIIDQLSSKYGDLGIAADDLSRKFSVAADAKEKFDQVMAESQKNDIKAQIEALQNENEKKDQLIEKYTATGGWAGWRARGLSNARGLGKFFGVSRSAEDVVGELGNDKIANLKKIQDLRKQLEGLDAVQEAKKADVEEKRQGVDAESVRNARTAAAEFEKNFAESGTFEKQRGEIEKQFTDYLAAQKKILDSTVADQSKTDQERASAQDAYNANVAKARSWFESKTSPINAEEERANKEAARNLALAEAQTRLYAAQNAYKADASGENKKALDDAAKALADVKQSNEQETAQDAIDRLTAAANALREAQLSGDSVRIEAAQKALADAQSSALDNLEPVKESLVAGTFDAFEAFDMTNDWEREAIEKQTETLGEISANVKDMHKSFLAANRDENGVVFI